ncbi:DUF1552 domain-containing protein [Fontisphaera persica]|uniref:DUF1552 domain-containing protein n=1 Tax=Fontisphaera persica TaxID=2974023 RepID=UPI0024C04F86|nr:DUF1552 domain-containing protein [Fontisphaera persica]WCJ59653.1 DUF1552 domain-containing protein [Fontisphaera persica]
MIIQRRWQLSRRTFLRGVGVSLALPLLEAMIPRPLQAAAATQAGKSAAPLRMAFIFTPNGAHMPEWTPKTEGPAFELPRILEPLAPVREDLLVLTGLTHDKARPNGDGPGDHARSCATFLTAAQAKKTHGADIQVGVSIDQVAAARWGQQTPLPSLELGCDHSRSSGNCDSGYSCAYSFNVSWKTPSLPMPPEVNPRLVFERLFQQRQGATTEAEARRARQNRSVLDLVLEDARQLRGQLGLADQRKLDEYLDGVRELERRIEAAEKFARAVTPTTEKPNGIPKDYTAHLDLMYDLMALAFQTDTTRIITFMVAHDGSNRSYRNLGISEGHHELSHHGRNAQKQEMIARINRFHVERFARFLQTLKSTKEGNGTLLDNCMIVYGSGISDGDRHNHDDLPVLLAGRAGGAFKTGRHLRYPRNTPMANLFLSMMAAGGTPIQRHGDSTGPLQGLT